MSNIKPGDMVRLKKGGHKWGDYDPNEWHQVRSVHDTVIMVSITNDELLDSFHVWGFFISHVLEHKKPY